jgi:hypothetical protein
MKHCCNCKNESLFYPYVCPDCLGNLKELQDENRLLRKLLDKASQILQNNGFENESKAIDCMAEL